MFGAVSASSGIDSLKAYTITVAKRESPDHYYINSVQVSLILYSTSNKNYFSILIIGRGKFAACLGNKPIHGVTHRLCCRRSGDGLLNDRASKPKVRRLYSLYNVENWCK